MIRTTTLIGIIIVLWSGLHGCTRVESAPAEETAKVECEVELRSWVVAGRGRHLYLECDCPEGFERLEDRIEFTSAGLRWDFDATRATDSVHRIARMTRGKHLHPVMVQPDNRVEARWVVDVSVVEDLQADRVFTEEYRLLGPNSNSGMRWALEHAGLALPAHVAEGGGMLGEFPGIELAPGGEVPGSLWESVGITGQAE